MHIVITGGTIDKTYNPLTGELVFAKSYIPEMLQRMRITPWNAYTHLMSKDSLEMTDTDRIALQQECQQTSETHILITHGTDTMVQTAAYLHTIVDKTIVLTGAMIPYSMDNSDALANVGFALGALPRLPCGIYIAMNGEIFAWNEVEKNREKGIFVRI